MFARWNRTGARCCGYRRVKRGKFPLTLPSPEAGEGANEDVRGVDLGGGRSEYAHIKTRTLVVAEAGEGP
jgi:hypothetical protein